MAFSHKVRSVDNFIKSLATNGKRKNSVEKLPMMEIKGKGDDSK